MSQSFVLPANGVMTPEMADRKRRLAEALMMQGGGTEPIRSPWQGAAKIAQGLIGALAMNQANRAEGEGRKSASEAMVRALGGGTGVAPSQQDPRGDLISAMGNPWANDMQQRLMMDQWQRMNQQPDPMADLEMQYKQAQIDKMRHDMQGNPQNSEAGLNLVYWKDAQGNLHAGQPLKGGGMKEVPLPEGGQWAPGVGYLDTGTGYMPYDKRAGIAPQTEMVQKDLAGVEREKAIGDAEGKAIAAAPSDVAAAEQALGLVDSIANDANLDWGVGGTSVFNVIPGTPGYDFQNKVDQATSGAFLSAIEQMRGLGQLSNADGQTATRAVTRLNTATSKEAFLDALKEYRSYIELARSRAQRKIRVHPEDAPSPPPVSQTMPQQQSVAPGKSDMGGTPNQGGDAYQEGDVLQNAQGQRVILRNNQWVPYDGQ